MVTELLESIREGLEQGPSWLSVLLDASVKATVLLGAAALANRLLRRSPASARHAVWVAAVASAVILPLLAMVMPAWRLEILPISQRPTPRVTPVTMPVHAMATAPLPPDVHPPRRAPESYTPLLIVPTGAGSRHVVVATPAPAPAPRVTPPVVAISNVSVSAAPEPGFTFPFSWPVALAGLWVLGTAVFLARILAGRIGVWRLAQSATPVTRHGWLALNRRLARELGIRREVLLVESESVALPMTWGIRHPVVLLPTAAECWTTERLELVLLHELSHVRRLDALSQLLAQLTCAFYWFHPLAWLAERRMRALREYACDDTVLAAGNRASEYAGQILDIVRSIGRRDPHAHATLAMARQSSQLEGRLMAILDPQLPRRALGRLGTSVVSLGFLALVLPLAAFQPAAVAQTASEKGPLPRLSQQESARRSSEPVTTPSATPEPTPVLTTGEAPAPTASAAPAAQVAPAAPVANAAPMIAGGVCRESGRTTTNINSSRSGGRTFNARREGEGCLLEVETQGEVSLGSGDDAVTLAEGASFKGLERTDTTTRRFEARASRSGGRTERWVVNGRERPVDAEARAFVESLLAELGPNSLRGRGAVARAPEAPRAPEAVRAPEAFRSPEPPRAPVAPRPPEPFAMVAPTPPAPPAPPAAPRSWSFSFDDDAPEEYRDQLQEAKADEKAAREALARVERSHNGSDSKLAEGLMDVASDYRFAGENTRQTYLNLASRIRSADLRRDVLKKLMSEAPISIDTGARILEVAKGIQSDEALGDVLDYMHRIKEHDLAHGPLALAYVDTASGLRSDEALADALYNMLHPHAPPEAALAALKLAQRIGSDEQRHRVLIEIKDHQPLTREMESAYLTVANGLRSSSEREEALDELDEAKSDRGGRLAMVFRNSKGNGNHDEAARAAERRAEEIERQAERIREQAERVGERERARAEREAERAEREAERAAEIAEREAERAAEQAERDAERQAQLEEQRSRQVAQSEIESFRAESRRMAEEARRMKMEAKRLAKQLKDKAEQIKAKFGRDLDEAGYGDAIDEEVERLEETLND